MSKSIAKQLFLKCCTRQACNTHAPQSLKNPLRRVFCCPLKVFCHLGRIDEPATVRQRRARLGCQLLRYELRMLLSHERPSAIGCKLLAKAKTLSERHSKSPSLSTPRIFVHTPSTPMSRWLLCFSPVRSKTEFSTSIEIACRVVGGEVFLHSSQCRK